ncbi:hypothetical protein VPNG_06682 [Cytospora leucostoma]|uniref:Uncharacterized protein n=1 Tax=Cytospora leucostoma TaxID=1230097 RepID=A0A423WTZ7_9PEZI|nr:hypothetical protein VPNG_06682 [Cytospora leucostoma]
MDTRVFQWDPEQTPKLLGDVDVEASEDGHMYSVTRTNNEPGEGGVGLGRASKVAYGGVTYGTGAVAFTDPEDIEYSDPGDVNYSDAGDTVSVRSSLSRQAPEKASGKGEALESPPGYGDPHTKPASLRRQPTVEAVSDEVLPINTEPRRPASVMGEEDPLARDKGKQPVRASTFPLTRGAPGSNSDWARKLVEATKVSPEQTRPERRPHAPLRSFSGRPRLGPRS